MKKFISNAKTLKNYISINILSLLGYLFFINIVFTVIYVKHILMDTTGIDREMFYGVAYNIYKIGLLLIQILLNIILYFLYKFEKIKLKKQNKTSYITVNNRLYEYIFSLGLILFFITYLFFYKSIWIILLALISYI